jgi:hypothetical protein
MRGTTGVSRFIIRKEHTLQNQGSTPPSTAALGAKISGGGNYAVPTYYDNKTERLSQTHHDTVKRLLAEAQNR